MPRCYLRLFWAFTKFTLHILDSRGMGVSYNLRATGLAGYMHAGEGVMMPAIEREGVESAWELLGGRPFLCCVEVAHHAALPLQHVKPLYDVISISPNLPGVQWTIMWVCGTWVRCPISCSDLRWDDDWARGTFYSSWRRWRRSAKYISCVPLTDRVNEREGGNRQQQEGEGRWWRFLLNWQRGMIRR